MKTEKFRTDKLNRKSEFEQDVLRGKEGERLIRDFYENRHYADKIKDGELKRRKRIYISDVSNEPFYQKIDVDFLLCDMRYFGIKPLIKIEVKWDEKVNSTGNMVIELKSKNLTDGYESVGWYKKTKAHYLYYGDAKSKKFYIFTLKELREYVNSHNLIKKTFITYETDKFDRRYKCEKIAYLIKPKEISGCYILDMNTYEKKLAA